MDKYELISKIKQLDGLTDDEKSALLGLLRSQKKYGLVWEDKPEAVEDELKNKLPVLTEVKDKAIVNDTDSDHYPNHILIEGDNLHALTVLNYTHNGKFDLIYIDPPYNTGNNDFVYNDKMIDKEDSYRHSKWLSFMKKRLQLCRSLLSERGVIFISIDDNEQAHLKLLCDKVFTESNFIATLPTIMNLKGNQDEFGFAGTHEYTLVYAKNYNACVIGQLPIEDEELDNWIEDDRGFYKKGANLKSTGVNAPKEKRPYLFYPILINKKTLSVTSVTDEEYKQIYDSHTKVFNFHFLTQLQFKYNAKGYYFVLPITNKHGMSWRWSRNKVLNDSDDIIVNVNGEDISIYKKQRPQLGDLPSKKPKSIFYKPEYSSGNGKSEITSVMGSGVFGYPKPLELIKDFITIGSSKNSVILDFFAGSGTTLDATMKLNAEDGGHRQCILVTNNENGICENVTYVRNKKVIEGYTTPKGEDVEGLHHNNLRYYKTDFVPRVRTVKNMRNLVNAATDMLCIKENMYKEKKQFGPWKRLQKAFARHFVDGEGGEMIIIYDETRIDEIVNAIKGMEFDKPLKVYVFSQDRDPYEDEFNDVLDKVELCALPAAIYDAYVQVLPKPQDEKVEIAENSGDEDFDSFDEEKNMDLAAEEEQR